MIARLFQGDDTMILTPLFKKAAFFLTPLLAVSGCSSIPDNWSDSLIGRGLKDRLNECDMRGIERNAFSWQRDDLLISLKPEKGGATIQFRIGGKSDNRNTQDGWSLFPCTTGKAKKHQQKQKKRNGTSELFFKEWAARLPNMYGPNTPNQKQETKDSVTFEMP